MSSYRRVAAVVLVIAAMVLMSVGPAYAEGNVIYVSTLTEVPASVEVCAAAGGVRDAGDGACVLAYGDFMLTPNGSHLRASRVGYWRSDSLDPRLTGYDTVESNLSLNLATGTSRMWGTWHLVPDGSAWQPGTGWQGTWEAHALPGGKFFMVGHGEGTGSFEGLRVVMQREVTLVITTGR
jgi:hypothetical protein